MWLSAVGVLGLIWTVWTETKTFLLYFLCEDRMTPWFGDRRQDKVCWTEKKMFRRGLGTPFLIAPPTRSSWEVRGPGGEGIQDKVVQASTNTDTRGLLILPRASRPWTQKEIRRTSRSLCRVDESYCLRNKNRNSGSTQDPPCCKPRTIPLFPVLVSSPPSWTSSDIWGKGKTTVYEDTRVW